MPVFVTLNAVLDGVKGVALSSVAPGRALPEDQRSAATILFVDEIPVAGTKPQQDALLPQY